MAVEASLSKPLYKIELYLLKMIRMVMVTLCLANMTLFYFGIDAAILNRERCVLIYFIYMQLLSKLLKELHILFIMITFAQELSTMKKYLYIALVSIAVFIGGLLLYQRVMLEKYRNLYEKELQNVEAYKQSNAGLEGEIREYKMTMDDLRASRDSIDIRLAEVVDELKIKDKKIEYLQYQVKVAHKTDTIQIPDTIFVPEAHVDTLIGDKWYNLRLRLDYPSTIVASPTFNSEQYVVINSKKEYNKKPSKIFFIRWFQRKHTTVEVNVEEKSPYITNKENKFIKILK